MRAEGNAASAIPPLAMGLPDSLKAYPEPPKLSETQARSGIIGTRTESTSLVATQPGELTLPEVHDHVVRRREPAGQIRDGARAYDQLTGAARLRRADAQQQSTPARSLSPHAVVRPALRPSCRRCWTPHRVIDFTMARIAAAFALTGWAIRMVAPSPQSSTSASIRANGRKRPHIANCAGRATAAIPNASAARSTAGCRALRGPLADAARRFGRRAGAHDALNALNARLYQRDAADFRCGGAAPLRRGHARRESEARAVGCAAGALPVALKRLGDDLEQVAARSPRPIR